MFKDAGKKIKRLAEWSFVLWGVLVPLVGIAFIFVGDDLDWIGYIMVGFPVIGWIAALMLYGFGEIVDTAIINRNAQPANVSGNSTAQTKAVKWCCPRCGKLLSVSDAEENVLCCAHCKNRYAIEKKGLMRHLVKV